MEKAGTGSFDLERIMPKTVGGTQNAEKKPARTPTWEDKGSKSTGRSNSTGEKDDFSTLQNISGY